MRIPSATLGDLNEMDLGAHVLMLCEDWNEPTRYEVGESWAWNNARTWIVLTPVSMYFDEEGVKPPERPTETWVVATYEVNGEGDWISIVCIDPNTGKVVYSVGDGPGYNPDYVGPPSESDIIQNYLSEQEVKRGELAGTPDVMPCYECTRARKMDLRDPIMIQVKALGPIVEARRDPTQTYVLSCGHKTIG
jgi:hypothetical protein